MNKYLLSLLAGLAVMTTGCTLSEPSEPSGNPSALRLKSVKSMGINLITFDYDNQGRTTSIKLGDISYQFSYDDSSSTPSEIRFKSYDTYNDHKVIDEEFIWTNIKTNASGFITSCHSKDTYYYYDSDYTNPTVDVEDGVRNFNYQDGHLTSITSNGDGIYLLWENDLLVRSEADGDYVTFSYTDVENVAGQWDPNNEYLGILGPILTTGFFGNAPAKFCKSAKFHERYSSSNDLTIQYSYSLLENGLIQYCRVLDSETPDFVPTLNYVYEKAK